MTSKPGPKPLKGVKRKTYSFTLLPDVKGMLELLAAKKGISASEWILRKIKQDYERLIN